jgi:hypothetical protein
MSISDFPMGAGLHHAAQGLSLAVVTVEAAKNNRFVTEQNAKWLVYTRFDKATCAGVRRVANICERKRLGRQTWIRRTQRW